jgi:hypothetical protein
MLTNQQKRMLAAHALRSGQPLQSIPFAAVVVAGVDSRDSELLLSFIRLRIVVQLLFLIIAIVCLSEKDHILRKPES